MLKRMFVSLSFTAALYAEVAPTVDEGVYGPNNRNTFDLWQAPGDFPRPLLIYIHGGSWTGFDKDRIIGRVPIEDWLAKGVSVASIDYRLTTQDAILPAPVHDAARAVQFFRSQAQTYNIDPQRIVLQGGSAGACSAMWIALHDDLADSASSDPVLRESTRVSGAYAKAGQTSIDPVVLDEWIGPLAAEFAMIYNAVGAGSYSNMMANYEQHKPLLDEFSPILHVDADDPPLWLGYTTTNPPTTDQQAIHHGNFGVNMKARSDEVGHTCYLSVGDQILPTGYSDPIDFLESLLLPEIVSAAANYRFYETFENVSGMSGTPGTLAGQNGWSVSSGRAVVQSNSAFEGSQALELENGGVGRNVVSADEPLWISFRSYVSDTNFVAPNAEVSNRSIAFYINSNLNIVVYSNNVPVELNTRVVLNSWNHFAVYSDNVNHSWSLSVNGTNAVSGLPLASYTPDHLVLELSHNAGTAGYVDNLVLTDREPINLAADSDGDSIPDWWEQTYFGHPTSADGAADDDGDGYTLRQEYLAGLNPAARDRFEISVEGNVPGSFRWPSVPGRLYDVYWTPDLLTPFSLLSVGRPSVSNTYQHAESDGYESGFYRIGVRPGW